MRVHTNLSKEFKCAAKVIDADTRCYAVQLNNWQCDEARTSVFAESAYDALLICVSEDSEDAYEMKRMMDDTASLTDFGFISNQWKSTKDIFPTGLNKKEFEKWLWRLEVEAVNGELSRGQWYQRPTKLPGSRYHLHADSVHR